MFREAPHSRDISLPLCAVSLFSPALPTPCQTGSLSSLKLLCMTVRPPTQSQLSDTCVADELVASPEHPSLARYLRYDEGKPVVSGLNHQLRNLQCLIAEAHAAHRLALLPPLRLEKRHNLGVANDWRWETYFDLEASRIVDVFGKEHPLPLVRGLPSRSLWTQTLAPRERFSEMAANAEMVIRRIRNEVFSRNVPSFQPTTFRMRPSARVLSMARPVVATLRSRWPAGYAAVHIRRSDRLWGPMKWLMRPSHIRRRLHSFGISDGAGVYFLSDERDPVFWAALAPHYEIARYPEFPELATLVSGVDGRKPDNYLLYEVEKEVMRHAQVRIETFPGPEYEPSLGTLVPPWVWIVARRWRKTVRAGLRLAHRVVLRPTKAVLRLVRDHLRAWRNRSGGRT